MNTGAKILIIEDDPGIGLTLRRVLQAEQYEVVLETRGDQGLARARQEAFDVVVTDLKLPGLSGLDLVREVHAAKPRLPIILMTAFSTTETAIEATKGGAFDYLVKPFELPEFLAIVGKAAANSRLVSQPVEWAPGGGPSASVIIGQSRLMQTVYKEIGRIAAKPVSVLIRGETGTGKELIARAIYQHGDRAQAPFVAINCAAIPETLLESELFGHERGAFTGAEFRRIGRFEQANHGTIFLDEIGDMSPSTQVKLLRVLQEKSLQRLGGKENIAVDARVIAATHRDLEQAMREKQFREDLYYRLSTVVIRLPALRERREDMLELVRFFLNKYGLEFGLAHPSILPEAVQFLQGQPWPGNVRELENVLRKALLLAGDFTINLEHVRAALDLGSAVAEGARQTVGEHVGALLAAAERGEVADAHARLMEAVERELFRQAIERARGNQAKAARWLGISRLTVREKLTHFGLHPEQSNRLN
jgi:DNA-binding NtrC family response regulator